MAVSYLRREASSALTAACALSIWALVSGQFVFDDGDALGKLGDFVLQTADLFVRVLQLQQVFDVRKHSALDSIDSSMLRGPDQAQKVLKT